MIAVWISYNCYHIYTSNKNFCDEDENWKMIKYSPGTVEKILAKENFGYLINKPQQEFYQ